MCSLKIDNNLRKIKVLIVDDSLISRKVLSMGISSDPSIEVVAQAVDPFDARNKIIEYKPDVMICDVEMPKMNGIEFIRRLLPQYPLPVIVVSAISSAVFDALDAGAVDFVPKPDFRVVKSVEDFINDLIAKIKIAASATVLQKKVAHQDSIRAAKNENIDASKIIAIGASTGGVEAIHSILKYLPSTVPGIVIVQHIPPVFSKMFAERLNASTSLMVKEAQTGDYIKQGKVLIAPGDKHMRIKKVGKQYKVQVFSGDKVNGHRPSVDVLFESVAKEAGDKAIGIILTGMGYDGAQGILAMRQKGARTIGQDKNTSVVYGMPKSAFDIGGVEFLLPLQEIPRYILNLLQ